MATREEIYRDALQRIAAPSSWKAGAICVWCVARAGADHDVECPVAVADQALSFAPCVGTKS